MNSKHCTKLVSFLLCLLLLIPFWDTPQIANAKKSAPKLGNTASNLANNATAIKSGNDIYYSNPNTNSIYKYNVKTKKKTRIYKNKKYYAYFDFNLYNDTLICTVNTVEGTDFADYSIFSIKTNGTHAKLLAHGHSPSVVNGNIYYIRSGKTDYKNEDTPTYGICRMTLTGTKSTALKKTSKVTSMYTDGSSLFYTLSTKYDNTYLYSMSLTGKSNKKIGLKNSEFVSVDSTYVYYQTRNGLYKYHRTKHNSTKLCNLLSYFYLDLPNITNGTLYYSSYSNSAKKYILYQRKLTRSSKTALLKEDGISNICIYGSYIIYTANLENDDTYTTAIRVFTPNKKKITLTKFFTP